MILRTSLFLLLVTAATAAAAPRVDLDRCVAFDAADLARAIDRELPIDVGEHPYVVVVQCPDLVTAIMDVEPEPASGAVARTLDLGEVPTDLRLKLLALAAAEMVKVAAALSAPTSPPRIADHPMPVARPRPMPKPVAAISETTSAPLPFTISPRVGMRLFAMTPHPLANVGAEIGVRAFRIGISGAYGQHTADPALIRAWLATVTLAYALCSNSWCVLARGEVGGVGAVIKSNDINFIPDDLTHTYAQIGPAFEFSHDFDRVTFVAELDGGYSWGVIADAPFQGDRAFALAGFVGAAQLGVRWQ